jgi:hypothetical protein
VSAAPQIVFNFADGQNQFFVELAEVLVHELHALGVGAEITHGEYPEPRRGRVIVLLPPHEYVKQSGFRPPAEMLARCIGISTEQPTSAFFEQNVKLARELGAVLDINHRAIRRYAAHGIAAEHLPLGYSPVWDRFDDEPRDLDVVFLGRLTARRERAISRYANAFERLHVHIQLADGHRPGWTGRPDFVSGKDKLDLLARAKVLLTIHGEDEPYFEWLRVAEAVCAGAMIVTEHSSDFAPLRHGEHLVSGGIDRLALLCAWAVENDSERERIRRSAYELLRDQYSMTACAELLARVAGELDARTADVRMPMFARHDFIRARRTATPQFEFQPDPSPHDVAAGRTLRALKSQTLTLLNVRRRLDAFELRQTGQSGPSETRLVYETPSWPSPSTRRLAVIVPLYNHRFDVLDALESALHSQVSDWELIVVDDGSDDGGGEAVHAWLRDHQGIPGRLVRHDVNRGLAHARNTGVEYTGAPVLLMLDADNELRATAMGRLLAALESDPAASFAYGIIERFSSDGPVGLLSVFPWDPQRLRSGNYIDALALIRRDALSAVGGYSSDARLALGWEDYDLWARIAESGGHGAFVPEIIARYRVGHSSMVSVTNISTTDAYAAIADHAPGLMRGTRIPV